MEETKIKVLLAEDDKNLGNILKSYLEVKGYSTVLCTDGEQAFEAFEMETFQICILDIMMPKKDGFTLAKEIRKISKAIPIIFLSAKSMEEDKLKGFEFGADDYVTKPFSMEELLLRIKAILRRAGEPGPSKMETGLFEIGKFRFDYHRQLLIKGEEKQKLTSKEAALLKLLCDHMNGVVDRSLALTQVWNDDSYFNARSMDVYITKLRKYLKADPTVELMNVHGIGFKLLVSLQT